MIEEMEVVGVEAPGVAGGVKDGLRREGGGGSSVSASSCSSGFEVEGCGPCDAGTGAGTGASPSRAASGTSTSLSPSRAVVLGE